MPKILINKLSINMQLSYKCIKNKRELHILEIILFLRIYNFIKGQKKK